MVDAPIYSRFILHVRKQDKQSMMIDHPFRKEKAKWNKSGHSLDKYFSIKGFPAFFYAYGPLPHEVRPPNEAVLRKEWVYTVYGVVPTALTLGFGGGQSGVVTSDTGRGVIDSMRGSNVTTMLDKRPISFQQYKQYESACLPGKLVEVNRSGPWAVSSKDGIIVLAYVKTYVYEGDAYQQKK